MLDLFDIPIYLVNLKKDKLRKKQSLLLFQKLGFRNIHVIVPIHPHIAYQHPIGKKFINKYKASHALTFLSVIKNNINPYFIIIEDDLIPVNNINVTKHKLIETWNKIKKINFDLFYFEYCNEILFYPTKHFNKYDNKIETMIYPTCAAFILYSNSAKDKILNSLKKYKKTDDMDTIYQKEIYNKKLIAYGNYLFRQNPVFNSNLPGSFRSYPIINQLNIKDPRYLDYYLLKIILIIIVLIICIILCFRFFV